MIRRPPTSTRTDTLFPYPTLFRSRAAFAGVSTLFLLNAVVPDDFTQALVALNVARQAGIERVVYLSVIHSDVYVNVPHFAGKFGVERMIERKIGRAHV